MSRWSYRVALVPELVRKERLELSRVAPLAPKTSASTDSATFAACTIDPWPTPASPDNTSNYNGLSSWSAPGFFYLAAQGKQAPWQAHRSRASLRSAMMDGRPNVAEHRTCESDCTYDVQDVRVPREDRTSEAAIPVGHIAHAPPCAPRCTYIPVGKKMPAHRTGILIWWAV
jgi:hypothetical protein